MHEMSIAEGILDVALDTLRQYDATVIHSVQLDLGLMSGVSLIRCSSVGKPLLKGLLLKDHVLKSTQFP